MYIISCADAAYWPWVTMIGITTGYPTCTHTHRNRMLGVRNDSHFDKMREAEPTAELVKQELKIPHKHPIHHHKQTFKLEWKDTKQK